jgi:hypothetical protein
MKIYYLLCILLLFVLAGMGQLKNVTGKTPVQKYSAIDYFPFVKAKVREIMKAGFNAGDGYREVWIRDYNTFIELAAQVKKKKY